ncbi:hypothetical protein JOF56_003730 [Kibdelosporangium banguiense]|uniref:Uncharacterized protein n=1 Tax=Kibdelosporangium banguiense TaxID=1365924 RepID=A0ABS4TH41_9PSEU|nr:hypothetical protein [Kibdelosporangium banguiense]MBP2323345.1 hypothetical protein [Kibdelosporangium banguiense]
MIHVWMSLDPETRRVTLQTREFGDGDLPRGLRGQGWPIRQAHIDETTWDALLAGELTAVQQDDLHRTLWTENGATAWPDL